LNDKGADGPLFCFSAAEIVDARLRRAFSIMRDALMRLLEPPIEALGFEVLDIEFARVGRGGTLRIFIDRLVHADAREPVDRGTSGAENDEVPSQGGISVDDCAAVSHAVSEVLDAEDPIDGHYTLEVSSPGLDRVLRKRAHFERFVGERVFVELKLPIEGRRRYAGELKSVVGETIVVEVDGQAHELPLDRIQKARLRPL
jgi:ribosome maturation factor RimP